MTENGLVVERAEEKEKKKDWLMGMGFPLGMIKISQT